MDCKDGCGIRSNANTGVINGPPLQGQQGQQGLRLEVSEDHIPLIKVMTS